MASFYRFWRLVALQWADSDAQVWLTWDLFIHKNDQAIPTSCCVEAEEMGDTTIDLFFDEGGLYIKVLLAFTALLTAACNCFTLASSLTAPLLSAFLPTAFMWTSLLSAPVTWSHLASVAGHFRFIKSVKKSFISVTCAGLGNSREAEGVAAGSLCTPSLHWFSTQYCGAIPRGEQEEGQGGDLEAGCMHTSIHLPSYVSLPCPRIHAPDMYAHFGDFDVFLT